MESWPITHTIFYTPFFFIFFYPFLYHPHLSILIHIPRSQENAKDLNFCPPFTYLHTLLLLHLSSFLYSYSQTYPKLINTSLTSHPAIPHTLCDHPHTLHPYSQQEESVYITLLHTLTSYATEVTLRWTHQELLNAYHPKLSTIEPSPLP